MPQRINLTGTAGKDYNLDELKNTNTRGSSSEALAVQVWEWNPALPEKNPHSKPNPENLVVGQIWLSKLISEKDALKKFGGE